MQDTKKMLKFLFCSRVELSVVQMVKIWCRGYPVLLNFMWHVKNPNRKVGDSTMAYRL
uniref:Uncharacterized protein n=1 Tax=Rhizophora mucronata TaxID=61149 RepID=A0A2P2M5D0_RHIMU